MDPKLDNTLAQQFLNIVAPPPPSLGKKHKFLLWCSTEVFNKFLYLEVAILSALLILEPQTLTLTFVIAAIPPLSAFIVFQVVKSIYSKEWEIFDSYMGPHRNRIIRALFKFAAKDSSYWQARKDLNMPFNEELFDNALTALRLLNAKNYKERASGYVACFNAMYEISNDNYKYLKQKDKLLD